MLWGERKQNKSKAKNQHYCLCGILKFGIFKTCCGWLEKKVKRDGSWVKVNQLGVEISSSKGLNSRGEETGNDRRSWSGWARMMNLTQGHVLAQQWLYFHFDPRCCITKGCKAISVSPGEGDFRARTGKGRGVYVKERKSQKKMPKQHHLTMNPGRF